MEVVMCHLLILPEQFHYLGTKNSNKPIGAIPVQMTMIFVDLTNIIPKIVHSLTWFCFLFSISFILILRS